MKSSPERVYLSGHRGTRLSGAFHLPSGEIRGGVILSHCFTCSKNYKLLAWLGPELAGRGYAVLRFDFAGLGMSEGDLSATTLSTDIQDLLAANRWMLERGFRVRTLVGHSMGGAAAILSAIQLEQLETVVTLGTGADVGGIKRLLKQQDWELLAQHGEVSVKVGGVERPIRREFLEDLERYSLADAVAGWGKGLLVIAGTDDRIVDCASQEKLFSAARQPKAFVAIRGADHLFANRRSHSVHIAALIDEWIKLNEQN